MLVIVGFLVKYIAYTAYIFGAIRALGTDGNALVLGAARVALGLVMGAVAIFAASAGLFDRFLLGGYLVVVSVHVAAWVVLILASFGGGIGAGKVAGLVVVGTILSCLLDVPQVMLIVPMIHMC